MATIPETDGAAVMAAVASAGGHGWAATGLGHGVGSGRAHLLRVLSR